MKNKVCMIYLDFNLIKRLSTSSLKTYFPIDLLHSWKTVLKSIQSNLIGSNIKLKEAAIGVSQRCALFPTDFQKRANSEWN